MKTGKKTNEWYAELNKLSEDETKEYRNKRKDIIHSFSDDKINRSFRGSKLHTGDLSPGCVHCGEGTWSCLYINGLCSASCRFCPQDRSVKKERHPMASSIEFKDPQLYTEYLKRFGYRGIGFSGGEPLMVMDRLTAFILQIRKDLDDDVYLWMYTNGELVEEKKLKQLKDLGLNEVRLNIAAQDYDLASVNIAKKVFDTVTIEIPVIPQDFGKLMACLPLIEELGISHLNLHQLYATKRNYKKLGSELTYLINHNSRPANVESEFMAYDLLNHVIDNNMELAVNICSLRYKNKFQGRAKRIRTAQTIYEPFENVTDAGYIRRVTITNASEDLNKITEIFNNNKINKKLWHMNPKKKELYIIEGLLEQLDCVNIDMKLQYYYAYIDKGKNGIIKNLQSIEDLKVKRKLASESPVLKYCGVWDKASLDDDTVFNVFLHEDIPNES